MTINCAIKMRCVFLKISDVLLGFFYWLSRFHSDITTFLTIYKTHGIQCIQIFTKRLENYFIRGQFALGRG